MIYCTYLVFTAFGIKISYLLFDSENIKGIILDDIIGGYVSQCDTKGAVNFSDAWNLCLEVVAGLIIPKPPSFTGRSIGLSII